MGLFLVCLAGAFCVCGFSVPGIVTAVDYVQVPFASSPFAPPFMAGLCALIQSLCS